MPPLATDSGNFVIDCFVLRVYFDNTKDTDTTRQPKTNPKTEQIFLERRSSLPLLWCCTTSSGAVGFVVCRKYTLLMSSFHRNWLIVFILEFLYSYSSYNHATKLPHKQFYKNPMYQFQYIKYVPCSFSS